MGRRKREDDSDEWVKRHLARCKAAYLEHAATHPNTELAKQYYLGAMRWRRGMEELLGGRGLTFSQWLVVNGTHELVMQADDAVSQVAIGAWVGLNRPTISFVMAALEEKGLVDRGPDPTGHALRVLLTRKASALLVELAPHIERLSQHLARPRAER